MGALQPNQDMMKKVAEEIDNDDLDNFMKFMGDFAEKSGKAINKILRQIKNSLLSPKFLSSINSVNDQGIKFIHAIGPIFDAMANMMTAMSPDPEVFRALPKIDNDDVDNFMKQMGFYVSQVGPAVARILREFAPVLNSVIEKVVELMNNPALSTVSPDKITAVAGIIGPIAEAIGGMAQGLGPIIGQMLSDSMMFASIQTMMASQGPQVTQVVASVTGMITSMFDKIIPQMGDLVDRMLVLAKDVVCPEETAAKIKTVASSLDILKVIKDIFRICRQSRQ